VLVFNSIQKSFIGILPFIVIIALLDSNSGYIWEIANCFCLSELYLSHELESVALSLPVPCHTESRVSPLVGASSVCGDPFLWAGDVHSVCICQHFS